MPNPTGRVTKTADGVDLTLTREFDASLDEIWADITDPKLTARWIGPWEAKTGETSARLQMTFEEGEPWSDFEILSCERPTRFSIFAADDYGNWNLEITLSEAAGTTTLTFVHHLADASAVGDIGPGWEYYLDKLVAARTGEPSSNFDAYYPSQQDYYQSQA